ARLRCLIFSLWVFTATERMNGMSWISKVHGQFAFFDSIIGGPDWKGKQVLDFGGNVGNILKDPKCEIEPRNYWCVDVSRDAIEAGKKTFSEAHWIFYNRYNFAFNPTGVVGLPLPEIGIRFDFILAYSVFTHIATQEMLELVDALRRLLRKEGVLAFTFIDPHAVMSSGPPGFTTLRFRLEKIKKENTSIDIDALLKRAQNANRCILVNDGDLYVESDDIKEYDVREQKSYQTFFTEDYMKYLFAEATIRGPLNGG